MEDWHAIATINAILVVLYAGLNTHKSVYPWFYEFRLWASGQRVVATAIAWQRSSGVNRSGQCRMVQDAWSICIAKWDTKFHDVHFVRRRGPCQIRLLLLVYKTKRVFLFNSPRCLHEFLCQYLSAFFRLVGLPTLFSLEN